MEKSASKILLKAARDAYQCFGSISILLEESEGNLGSISSISL